MELLTFGHAGARMLVFPTSMGRFFEWEDQGMMESLRRAPRPRLAPGLCVDSVDAESWYAKWRTRRTARRLARALRAYILHEVLPFSRHRNPEPYLIAAGASFGAYHALDLGLRHPTVVDRVIGLSGLYDIKEMTGGYSTNHVYRHDPSHF
jgi:esterase/lipase superfamily enzyme